MPALAPSTTRPLRAVVVLCFGGLSAALTQTLVIPIQSELPRLLDTSPSNAGWVVTITLLAAAVSMPVAGRLADLFGKQRVLGTSAVILLVGSVVCALSDSLAPMLAGRALQGLAMGFIPVGISLMREITPPDMSATAMAVMSAALGVGGAIGLPLSATARPMPPTTSTRPGWPSWTWGTAATVSTATTAASPLATQKSACQSPTSAIQA